MPYFIIVKLFFALFGLSSERDVMLTPENPDNIVYFQVKRVRFGNILLLVLDQFVFILYLLVTTIILINLLIAMMSDTYQRIQVSRPNNNFLLLENKYFSFSNNRTWSGNLADLN